MNTGFGDLILRALEIWFSPSGVTVTLLLVVLVLVLCAFFSKRAQSLIRDLLERGVRGKWRNAEIEFGTAPVSDLSRAISTADAPPAQPQKHGPPVSAPTPDQPGQRDDSEEGEASLKLKMFKASITRDTEAFYAAYDALLNLPNRRETDEDVMTYKGDLEYDMGVQSAIAGLAQLSRTHLDWFWPALKLARIHLSIDSHADAEEWMNVAEARARNKYEKLQCVLTKAALISANRSTDVSIQFLKKTAAEFRGSKHEAEIWEALSGVYKEKKDNTRSVLALERAVRLDPLNKDRRFNLAYEYSENDKKSLLAFYHYNKVIVHDERYPNAMNNFASVLLARGMAATGIAMLKRAKEFERPYPHGNLAIALAKAGFLDEAMQSLEELPPNSRIETRAADAAEFIRRQRDLEDQKYSEAVKASDAIHRAYDKAAKCIHEGVEPQSLLGHWSAGDEVLTLDQILGKESVRGTLVQQGADYKVTVTVHDRLLLGSATGRSGGLLVGIGMKKTLALAITTADTLEGIVISDDSSPKEVAFRRQKA